MFAKFSVRKPFTILVAVVLVIVLGAVSFSNMTPDLLPKIDLPYIMVMTTYVGAAPEEVEDTVTRPMEELLSTLDNVESVTSSSSENYSLVTLAFSDDADLEYAALAVREKLTTLSDSWEDKVGTPVILKISPDMIPVNVAAVSYDGMDTVALSAFVEDTLLPSLEGTEGIASVTAAGLVSERVEVQIEPDKIAAINERLAAKVLAELDDKKAELDDSKAELEEQLQKLIDGQEEVANGKDTLNEQQENAAEQLQNAKSELDSQKYALLEAKMQMSSKIAELENQIAQMDSSITAYESLQSKIAQAESGLKTAQDAVSSLTALSESLQTLETLKAQKTAAEDALTSLGLSAEDAQKYLTEQSEDYRNLLSAISQIEAAAASSGISAESIPAALEKAENGVSTATEALSQLDTVLASQGVTRDTLPAALEQLRTARTAAVSGKNTLTQKLSELENGQSTIDDALEELAAQETSAEQQLSSAMTELIVSEKTLESTRAQLEAGLEELNKGYEQLEDAREDALKAADISDSVTMTMLAQIYMHDEKNQPKAIELLENAVTLDNGQAADLLSMYYLKGTYVKKDFQKGIKLIKQAIRLGNKRGYVSYAQAYLDEGNYAVALPYAKIAVQEIPNDAQAMHILGRLYHKTKDYPNAFYWYNRSLSLYKEENTEFKIIQVEEDLRVLSRQMR